MVRWILLDKTNPHDYVEMIVDTTTKIIDIKNNLLRDNNSRAVTLEIFNGRDAFELNVNNETVGQLLAEHQQSPGDMYIIYYRFDQSTTSRTAPSTFNTNRINLENSEGRADVVERPDNSGVSVVSTPSLRSPPLAPPSLQSSLSLVEPSSLPPPSLPSQSLPPPSLSGATPSIAPRFESISDVQEPVSVRRASLSAPRSAPIADRPPSVISTTAPRTISRIPATRSRVPATRRRPLMRSISPLAPATERRVPASVPESVYQRHLQSAPALSSMPISSPVTSGSTVSSPATNNLTTRSPTLASLASNNVEIGSTALMQPNNPSLCESHSGSVENCRQPILGNSATLVDDVVTVLIDNPDLFDYVVAKLNNGNGTERINNGLKIYSENVKFGDRNVQLTVVYPMNEDTEIPTVHMVGTHTPQNYPDPRFDRRLLHFRPEATALGAHDPNDIRSTAINNYYSHVAKTNR